jgi:hypothetical protein
MVSSADMLMNHRDICFHMPPNHSNFGAIDTDRFKHLVRRYLLESDEIPIDDLAAVGLALSSGHGIFLSCSKYHGDDLNHMVRVIGISHDQYVLASPSFPHGLREEVTPATIATWHGIIIRVHSI